MVHMGKRVIGNFVKVMMLLGLLNYLTCASDELTTETTTNIAQDTLLLLGSDPTLLALGDPQMDLASRLQAQSDQKGSRLKVINAAIAGESMQEMVDRTERIDLSTIKYLVIEPGLEKATNQDLFGMNVKEWQQKIKLRNDKLKVLFLDLGFHNKWPKETINLLEIPRFGKNYSDKDNKRLLRSQKKVVQQILNQI